MALIQLLVFLILCTIARLAKLTQLNLKALVATTLIYLFIYLQPSFVQACMRLLSCRKIAEIDYITDNVSYRCDIDNPDSIYMIYSPALIVPILLAIIFFIPALMFYGLRRYSKLN